MGIYLNPGNENYRSVLASGTYVDKSMMLSVLNEYMDTNNKYICISRPRRFGKTIAGNMVSAYYSKGCESDSLFADLKISGAKGYRDKLNHYNVIKIDMNSEYQNTVDKNALLKRLAGKIKEEMRIQFPEDSLAEDDSLAECILKVYAKSGETFIMIIDEYDVLVRENVDKELLDEYLSFLNGLFKSDTLRPAIALAYLTGILPVVRDKIQSKLNNFHEYTILDSYQLSEYVGFTSEEVQALCKANDMNYEECRNWYDGYRQNGYEIYNPESVVMSMQNGKYGGYWGKTSTYEAISERIHMNFDGTKDAVIRMLAGESVDVSVGRFMNTMTSFTNKDDLFTYLIHLGYLAYDNEEETCHIPNREVRQEWKYAISEEEEYGVTNKIIEESKTLLKETIAGNEGAVASALDMSHIHVTSNRSYNNEDALQSAIYLAYIYALNDYTCVKEMTAGKGFADVVYIPIYPDDEKRPAMVIELKRNDSAESGLDQIKKREYFESMQQYSGNMLLIGIGYDEKQKTHTCRIERFVK